MRWCKKCVLPDSRPNLVIGRDGICNACKSHAQKAEINWESRRTSLLRVIEAAKEKSNGYDCLIPVSGGKDSTWQVVKCLELGLKPLTVTWRPPGRTAIGQRNLDNLRAIGVDHIDYAISPKVESAFMLTALKRLGSTGIPMHMALFNIPTTIAQNFGIPLIIWGENSAAEYGSSDQADEGHRLTSSWIKRYGVTQGTSIEDWVKAGLSEKDLIGYRGQYSFHEEKNIPTAIFLGYYLRWDPEETKRVAVENGFKVANKARTGYYDFADIDDDFISIHHWLKWYKFGFTRTHDNLSIEIRNNRLTRDEAIAILRDGGDETPYDDISRFCDFCSISVDDFFEICEGFRNTNIWKEEGGVWRIEDFLVSDWCWK